MTALKPVPTEQVRRPERSKPRDPTNPVSPRKTGPVRSKKPTQAEQKRPESRHRRPKASTPLYIFFIFFLAVSFKFISFQFFVRSGPVRVLAPSYRSPRLCRVEGRGTEGAQTLPLDEILDTPLSLTCG